MARGADQHRNPKSNIEIAQEAVMLPISEIAGEKLAIPEEAISPYGKYKAKIALDYMRSLPDRPDAKLILVTAITPTPAGEGKTTTTVGLGDALNLIGKKAMLCLREASMGPCFGVKGGAAGGGYAQVVPMEDINLHFTGDIHAIGAANNLLAAMVDNHVYYGLDPRLDPRRVSWRRAMDMNDRALRSTVSSLGGVANGYPREDGFDITAASQVMATFCLATSLQDLQRRLGNIHRRPDAGAQAGDRRRRQGGGIDDRAAEGRARSQSGADDRAQPGLYPRRPVRQYRPWLQFGDRDDIGAQARRLRALPRPASAPISAPRNSSTSNAERRASARRRPWWSTTVRALKMHGGVALNALREENVEALEKGFANLSRHLANIRQFGVPAVVSVNRFSADTAREHKRLQELCAAEGVKGGHRRPLG